MAAKALDGIRVIDFSRVFAGPAAAQILGDMGADVIKVEAPNVGDEARYYGTDKEGLARCGGVGPSFLAFNRNKRSIALDLRSEAGRDTAFHLLAQADVTLHNFRPGTMERFGLGYDRVRAENPGIVYGQLSSFGVEGPMRDIGANDLSLQAHSGMMSITGDPDRPPVRVGSASIDLHAGLALATAILGALFHRQRSGEGQFVESSLLRSASDLMGYFYTEYWTLGIERGRAGTANHLSVPNQAFPTKDGSVVVISPGDDMWKRCAEALDKDSLGGPEYATMFDRRQRRDKLIAKITAVTQEMTSKELIERLSAAKVNVANVNTISQASADPQLPAIGGVYDFTYRTVQARAVAAPFAMQGTPLDLRRSPPELGAHNREILAEFGFSESEIDRLAQIGAHGPDPEAQ